MPKYEIKSIERFRNLHSNCALDRARLDEPLIETVDATDERTGMRPTSNTGEES
jgi:hypothetical protein